MNIFEKLLEISVLILILVLFVKLLFYWINFEHIKLIKEALTPEEFEIYKRYYKGIEPMVNEAMDSKSAKSNIDNLIENLLS